MWAVRRAGIGSALRDGPAGPGDPRPLAIIEDPAVPPERLPELARGIRRILDREGLDAVWYGHASVGCLHIRPRMDLRAPGAVAALRRIAEETADLVCSLDGSLSGEHGDGRARSELLPRMYPPATIAAFAELKRLLDPGSDPEPRGADRAGPPGREPAAGGLTAAARPEHGDELRRGGGPGARRRGLQRQRRLPRRRRGHVPELPGARRRAPLHPRPGGDPARRARGPAAGRPGRRRAARGPRAVPGLQGLRRGVPRPASTWPG